MAQSRPPTLTLLIVEDEPLIRIELAGVLSDMGYTVLEASNADDAIFYLETHPEIVAVITDLSMPGSLDGLALPGSFESAGHPARSLCSPGTADLPRPSLRLA